MLPYQTKLQHFIALFKPIDIFSVRIFGHRLAREQRQKR
jgi:hypothetical protein